MEETSKETAEAEEDENRQLARLRKIAAFVGSALLLLIAYFWFESYFVGRSSYRSTWRQSVSGDTERAGWLISNYGSFGLAWRRQEGYLDADPPADVREIKQWPASPTAMGNIHRDGVVAWHWIHFSNAPASTSGSISHRYGDFFIPYWMPFLVILVTVISVNTVRIGGK